MNRRFRAALLLGAGNTGAGIARAIQATLVAREPEVGALVSCLCLEDGGAFSTLPLGGGAPQLLVQVEGLDAELKSGVFRANADAVRNVEKEIGDSLVEAVVGLRRQDVIGDLQEKGWEIDGRIAVYLVTALSDAVGSAALVPVLSCLQHTLKGRLRDVDLDVDVLGFFPDLIDEQANQNLAGARAYACLQELDFLADNPTLMGGPDRPPFNQVFLFTKVNEDGLSIDGLDKLSLVIGELTGLVLEGRIASDANFSLRLAQGQEHGKRTRYSSMGLAKLVFPVDAVLAAIEDSVGAGLLESQVAGEPATFDGDVVGGDVTRYVNAGRLERLGQDLQEDVDKHSIWQDFTFGATIDDRLGVGSFTTEIGEKAAEFERTTLTVMQQHLSVRRDRLLQAAKDALLAGARVRVDARADGGVRYASAFVDVLNGESSRYTKGGGITDIHDLRLIDREARKFFDTAYVVDREKVADLKRALKAKQEQLAKEFPDAGKPDVVPSPAADAPDAPAARAQALTAEIAALQLEYETRAAELATADRKIEDAAERGRLVRDLRSAADTEREKLVTAAGEAEKACQEGAHALQEAEEWRNREVRRRFVITPAIALGMAVLILLALTQFLSVLTVGALAIRAVRPFVVAMLIYFGWEGWKYWSVIRVRVEEAKAKLARLKRAKTESLRAIQASYNDIFRKMLEHATNGALVDAVIALREFVGQVADQIRAFIAKLGGLAKERRDRLAKLEFRNSFLIRDVVAKSDIEAFIKDSPQLGIERDRFFTQHSLSASFDAFRPNGDVARLVGDIHVLVEDVFKDLRTMSVERYLKESKAPGPLTPAQRFVNLVAHAKTFVRLSVERGQDESQDLVYLGVANPDNSFAWEQLQGQGMGNITPFGGVEPSQVVAAKLKVGFPAFQVVAVAAGQQALEGAADRVGCYALPTGGFGDAGGGTNADWTPPDLFPSEVTIGDESDAERQAVCLGRALGEVVAQDGKFRFGDNVLGATLKEAVEFLRRITGRAVAVALRARVEEAKKGPDAIARLQTFKSQAGVDRVDQAIIDRTLKELNPFS